MRPRINNFHYHHLKGLFYFLTSVQCTKFSSFSAKRTVKTMSFKYVHSIVRIFSLLFLSPPHLNDCIFAILGQNVQIEKPSDLVELHCITDPALGTQ
jgi:hypothetical protein